MHTKIILFSILLYLSSNSSSAQINEEIIKDIKRKYAIIEDSATARTLP